MGKKGKATTQYSDYVSPEEAYRHLTGTQSSAEAARLQMLKRMGLDKETGPAAEARERMIRRRERTG